MSTNEPTGQTPGEGGQTPWPQYGQVGDASATPAPSAGSTPTGPASVPGAPAPVPGGVAPYPATQPLPGRGKSIAMIIVGILLLPTSLVIFLVGTFASVAGGLGGVQFDTVSNGGTITVPDNAVVSVADGSGQATECALSGPSDVSMQETSSAGTKAFVAQSVPGGEYTLTCDAGDQLTYSLIGNGEEGNPEAVSGGVGVSALIATVVGILGLVLLIVGIVLLVKTNKKRREIRGY